ncbi:hypothetical protein DFH09DRAFT_1503285 [Mycena vulgaris]|nr:hypothetical protein DFH09DRAFT_1503285 [Mycena vulgaris]
MAPAHPSFDDMMDMPLDSSPLKSPTQGTSPTLCPTVPSPPGSPSPSSGSTLPRQRKRPAEDMSQYAGEVSRANKLVKADHDELIQFSKSGHPEQMLFLAGRILALAHHQKQLQPAEAPWVMPKRLQDKIDERAAILIGDCSIPAYRDDKIGPSKLLMDSVLANPGWGFTSAMKDVKAAVDVVSSYISRALTSKRNVVKSTILSSLGSDPTDGTLLRPGALDIVELAKLILLKLKIRAKVDLRLCGRISILRKLISEKNDNKYWGDVDTKLASVRQRLTDPVKQSKFIKQMMLDPDLQSYGVVNLTDLSAAPPAHAASTSSSGSSSTHAVSTAQPSNTHPGDGSDDE